MTEDEVDQEQMMPNIDLSFLDEDVVDEFYDESNEDDHVQELQRQDTVERRSTRSIPRLDYRETSETGKRLGRRPSEDD